MFYQFLAFGFLRNLLQFPLHRKSRLLRLCQWYPFLWEVAASNLVNLQHRYPYQLVLFHRVVYPWKKFYMRDYHSDDYLFIFLVCDRFVGTDVFDRDRRRLESWWILRGWHERRWNVVLVDHQIAWRGGRSIRHLGRLVILEEGITRISLKDITWDFSTLTVYPFFSCGMQKVMAVAIQVIYELLEK